MGLSRSRSRRWRVSIQDVRDMVSGLPRSLGEQVIGYAESVERSLPAIFREARRPLSPRLVNEVVFIAGVRKLHWLAASSYWILDNSGRLLASMDVSAVQVGGLDMSRG